MVSRRYLMAAGLATGAFVLSGCARKVDPDAHFTEQMSELQKRHGGRLGVAAMRLTAGPDIKTLTFQADQRFAMCSTFKWVLAAAVLQQADQGRLSLGDRVPYGQKDLLSYAPVTKMHAAEGGMSLEALCLAAVSLSDNTAANLLLSRISGPQGLTAFVRGLGDKITRFDRNEPALNSNVAGDVRDTTTPDAMTGLLQTLFTTNVLKPDSLQYLKNWMVATRTGQARIPAGVPQGAVTGHKTGSGAGGAMNDVGVIWPAGNKPPVFLSVFTTGGTLDDDGREAIIADITRLVFTTGWLS
ncbi:MAG: class A beta-lactamase [Asticcacaulis sp.]